MSAEYCLKHYLEKNNIEGLEVASAGTGAIPQKMNPIVKATLLSLGINPTKHKQRQIQKKHFDKYDLVVAMHKNHLKFIKEHFGKEVPLFDEICYGKKVSIMDCNDEFMSNYRDYIDEVNSYIEYTVKFINNSMPKFVKNVKNFVK